MCLLLPPIRVVDSFAAISLRTFSTSCPASSASAEDATMGGTALEGGQITMACKGGKGKIKSVDFADYGTPQGNCPHFTHNSACQSADALAVVKGLCEGKAKCALALLEAMPPIQERSIFTIGRHRSSLPVSASPHSTRR